MRTGRCSPSTRSGGVKTVVRAESGVWADHSRSGNAMSEEKRQDLVVKEITSGTGVVIQVNNHLLRRAGY
jgi:hypothetical protein